MNFSALAIKKPIPVILLFIILTVAGFMSFGRLPVQSLPDFDLPTITVSVSLPGATPATMETEVTRKLEDSIASLGSIEHIQSTVSDGSSITTVTFSLDKKTQEAVDDVRDAISRVRSQLPSDVKDPTVSKVTTSGGAILTYAIEASTRDEADLSWFVDNTINKSLLAIPGVSKVVRQGGISRQASVELDPVKLTAFGVTAADVSRQIRAIEQEAPSGQARISHQEQAVRTLATVGSVQELVSLPITLPDGRHLRLGDVAKVTDEGGERRQLALLDGKPVVSFQVFRSSGTSEVTVAAAVRAGLDKLQSANPEVKLSEISTTVTKVAKDYNASMRALYEGAVLAVLVVFLFLRDVRATLISAVALPLSIIPVFFAMKLFDFSLNSIVLLAMTLIVGLLVDDAIVEVENIVRHQRMGKPPLEAAKDAAGEIGLAVIATSLTLVSVFLPTAFMSGVPGKFFKQFGWTASLAVLASLLVARLLTPMMAAYWMKDSGHAEQPDGPIMRRYLRALTWCTQRPYLTLAMTAVLFVFSLFLATRLPSGFIPPADTGKVTLTLELAPGSTLAETQAISEEARRNIVRVPEVSRVFTSIGAGTEGSMRGVGSAGDVRKSSMLIDLKDGRERASRDIEADIRRQVAELPGVRMTVGQGGSGEKFSLVLSGDDPALLTQAANDVERDLRTLSGVGNVASSASLLRPEVVVRPDLTRAAELGVTAQAIGQALRVATAGDYDTALAKVNLPERQLPVLVKMADISRESLANLGLLKVQGRSGPVALQDVASLTMESGPAQIDRFDRKRNVTLTVELNGRQLGEVAKEVAQLKSLKQLPNGVQRQEFGEAERMRELFSSFGIAIALGIFCVYAVLVLLFHDFVHPVTILSALPLSIGGAFGALLIGGYSLSLSSLLGLILLMGIVTKNSILLVEYALVAQRERGLSRTEAILDACHKRARPIVMTTVAMVAGMVPIAVGFGEDNSFKAPMAVAVIGGLMASTLLSLLVVPVVFEVIDTLKARVANWRHRRA